SRRHSTDVASCCARATRSTRRSASGARRHARSRVCSRPGSMGKGRLRTFVVVSVVLLAVRLAAARVVGFGDSEALYACYALHPQPAYLDHPGLVGLFAR